MATYEERGSALIWQNHQGPWGVEVTCDLNAPFDGPAEVRVWFTPDPEDPVADVDAAIASDGIPTTLLRSIPLADIRAYARKYREVKERSERRMAAHHETPARGVPGRMTSEADYALFVAELARTRAIGQKSPQATLAARLGIGKATMSERVKKARELDLWDGKRVTPKAAKILEEFDREVREQQNP